MGKFPLGMGHDEETALEYELIPEGDTTTIRLTGEIDLGTLDDLRTGVAAKPITTSDLDLLDS